MAALVVFGGSGVAACSSILALNDYEIERTSCFDRKGFDGRGCFACDATTHELLITTCTSARCFPFDESRVPTSDAVGVFPDVPADVPADAADTSATDTAPDADAATEDRPCEEYGKPILVAGSSAMLGLLDTVGELLGDSRVLVYLRAPSCEGVTSIFSGTPQLSGSLPVFGHSKTKSCRITGSASAHIGISDVAFAKCAGVTAPVSEIEDVRGPVQVFMFGVPADSDQHSISAAAARRIYSLGAASDVAPWTDGRYVMMRHPGSGTQITLGGFIGLDAASWKGNSFQGSTEIAQACAGVPADARNKTICITSADQKDIKFKTSLKTLAFHAPGQPCGFLPDSDQNSFDKRNVRDGHYLLWAPVHFFARVDESSRQPRDPDVREALNLLTGQVLPADPRGMFEALKGAGLVPTCAMKVRRDRTDDFGPLKSELPPAPCGCAFENATPGAALGCRPCTNTGECQGSEVCRFGFCEAQ